MKTMKFTVLAGSLIFLSVAFFGCGGSSDPDGPANEISDASGLNITLEWSTGGSVSQAQRDVDLDLKLKKGTTVVEESRGLFFESVEMKDIYSDGDYTIEVFYFDGSKNLNYTIFVQSKSNTSKVLEYTGTLSSTDKNATLTALKINKSGTKYTASK